MKDNVPKTFSQSSVHIYVEPNALEFASNEDYENDLCISSGSK